MYLGPVCYGPPQLSCRCGRKVEVPHRLYFGDRDIGEVMDGNEGTPLSASVRETGLDTIREGQCQEYGSPVIFGCERAGGTPDFGGQSGVGSGHLR